MKDIKLIKADTCFPEETVNSIAKKMQKNKIRRMFVIDKKKKLLGVITTVDIVDKIVAKSKDPNKIKVKEIMTKKVKYVDKTDSLDECLKVMNQLKTFMCPITDNGRLMGVVSYQNILTTVVEASRK